jgi:hypothetical protein
MSVPDVGCFDGFYAVLALSWRAGRASEPFIDCSARRLSIDGGTRSRSTGSRSASTSCAAAASCIGSRIHSGCCACYMGARWMAARCWSRPTASACSSRWGTASCPRTGRRTGAKAASERADDATGRDEQTAAMNTTTQRRNKQARVATVSAPTIAEPRTDTPSTPPDIQPCANEGLHRTIPGSSQAGRRAGEPLWGEGKARAVRALADEQGLDLELVRLQQMATRTCRSSRRSPTRDLGFRWGLYMKNGPGSRFPFARLDRDPSGQADQG